MNDINEIIWSFLIGSVIAGFTWRILVNNGSSTSSSSSSSSSTGKTPVSLPDLWVEFWAFISLLLWAALSYTPVEDHLAIVTLLPLLTTIVIVLCFEGYRKMCGKKLPETSVALGKGK
jgi:hypothetical protein